MADLLDVRQYSEVLRPGAHESHRGGRKSGAPRGTVAGLGQRIPVPGVQHQPGFYIRVRFLRARVRVHFLHHRGGGGERGHRREGASHQGGNENFWSERPGVLEQLVRDELHEPPPRIATRLRSGNISVQVHRLDPHICVSGVVDLPAGGILFLSHDFVLKRKSRRHRLGSGVRGHLGPRRERGGGR